MSQPRITVIPRNHGDSRHNLHVIWRTDQWHIVGTGVAFALMSGDNKEELIQCACDLARNNNGEVQVYGKAGEVEAVYSYREGFEERHLGAEPQ